MSSIIKVDTIQNQSGANIISESSNTITVGASGDTITVPSGATLGGAGTVDLSSATVTLNDSMKNTPSFRATLSSNQTISHDTLTRVTFDTEEYDTNSAFASNIFTVPSGEGGKYAFHYLLFYDDLDDTDFCLSYIEVDGTIENGTQDQRYGSAGTQNTLLQCAGVITLTAGQTVEVVTKHGIGSNQELRSSQTYFQMHKMIGL